MPFFARLEVDGCERTARSRSGSSPTPRAARSRTFGGRTESARGGVEQRAALSQGDRSFRIDGVPDGDYAVRAFDATATGAPRQVWLGACYGVRAGAEPLPPGGYDLLCDRDGAARVSFRNLHLVAG